MVGAASAPRSRWPVTCVDETREVVRRVGPLQPDLGHERDPCALEMIEARGPVSSTEDERGVVTFAVRPGRSTPVR
jgi:hypothetical protein